MNLSPLAWGIFTVGVLALYVTAAVLSWRGHISDRAAAGAYLSTSVAVLAVTGATANWWPFFVAMPGAGFFTGLLASTWKDTT